MSEASVTRFASFVATLGRGPGRSRALTREEAREAMGLLMAGQVDPVQIGAFLMLLRYRGEDADEIAGLVEAARATIAIGGAAVDLDWPSYGAGRSRGAPWFLLAALALARSGIRVLMHGSNEFSAGMSVPAALAGLGMAPAADIASAVSALEQTGFAYLPIGVLSPPIEALLGLRSRLGLRSPINTVARLLDPGGARAAVDGVFHPPYIETHLAAAQNLGRPRLLVLKGGGGEAERNPAKPVSVHLWDLRHGRQERELPALWRASPEAGAAPPIEAVWRGEASTPEIDARIVGTIALGLLALDLGGDAEAAEIWRDRGFARKARGSAPLLKAWDPAGA